MTQHHTQPTRTRFHKEASKSVLVCPLTLGCPHGGRTEGYPTQVFTHQGIVMASPITNQSASKRAHSMNRTMIAGPRPDIALALRETHTRRTLRRAPLLPRPPLLLLHPHRGKGCWGSNYARTKIRALTWFTSAKCKRTTQLEPTWPLRGAGLLFGRYKYSNGD